MTYKETRLRRSSSVDLVFNGELLAHLQSRDAPDQLRWTELSIWRTDKGRYVTETIGKTVVPGEEDKQVVAVVDNPDKLVETLTRVNKKGEHYLTWLVREALEEAAKIDPNITLAVERL